MTLRDPAAVAVVLVGDELLRGEVADRNGTWLGARLSALGLRVSRTTIVPDDVAATVAAVVEAAWMAPVVVVAGGLGPTSDDRTRTALAEVAGVALVRDTGVERGLRDGYRRRGRTVTAAALTMALVPEGARVLPNPVGTAPGLHLRIDVAGGTDVFAVAGVPHELVAVAEASVLPAVLGLLTPGPAPAAAVLRVADLGEPVLAELLAPLEPEVAAAGGTVGYLAEAGEVRIRLTAPDPLRLAPLLDRARRVLGAHAYGDATTGIAAVVLRLLVERQETLAVAESVTGGCLAARITGVAGASAAFRGGVVAYATDLKRSLLGVAADHLTVHGAVDPQTSVAMARGVRERLRATWGLATTGVAGPDLQEGKPVGLVHLAVAGPSGVLTRTLQLPASGRDPIRTAATTRALDLLRRAVGERESAPAVQG